MCWVHQVQSELEKQLATSESFHLNPRYIFSMSKIIQWSNAMCMKHGNLCITCSNSVHQTCLSNVIL